MSELDFRGATVLFFILTVKCSLAVEPLKTRLVGGSGSHEGRVEVFYEGSWGTVCDDQWDFTDADVVCRSLGFARARAYNHRAAFGEGTGNIVLSQVRCSNTDANIAFCSHSGYLVHSCTHNEDAGVVCQGADPLPTRLVGGSGSHEGRVEVQYEGTWGTICDDSWTMASSHVVCRTIGYERAVGFSSAATGFSSIPSFEESSGDIILDDVFCLGSEPNIAFCQYRLNNKDCSHSEDVHVECEGFASARLVGGSSRREGRVEVLYNGNWGTVCDDQFDLPDAHVVCKMLGFSKGEMIMSHTFGPGTGDIIVDDLRCAGTELRIGDCPQKAIGAENCDHTEDVGVECDELPVRLAGSPNRNEGRVELYHEGAWGTICDDRWDIRDAEVVCRMLGYPSANRAVSGGTFTDRRGDSPLGDILLSEVECGGDETHITQCSHGGYGRVNNCDHSEDAGVVCSGKGDFQARLADGPDEAQGRVELFYYGTWGTACHLNWTSADSRVLCKMLGYPDVLDTAYYSSYGPGRGIVLLRQPRCSGKESSLLDCNSAYPIGVTECDHSMDIGVTCLRPNNLKVRLVGSQSRNAGRVEVSYGDSWGTVCDDNWDLNDANVVCRMLGYARAENYSCCAAFGHGTGAIALDEVDCKGTESNLGDCMRAVLGVNDCSHAEDVGVTCTSEGPSGLMRPPINTPQSPPSQVQPTASLSVDFVTYHPYDPSELTSDASSKPRLPATITYSLLGGLGVVMVGFLAVSAYMGLKMKAYRNRSSRLPQRRPAKRHVSNANQYVRYMKPPKPSGGSLYPSLSSIKETSNPAPVKGRPQGKGDTKDIVKTKTEDGKPSASVTVAGDSKKGMLTSLKEKLKLSR